MALECDNRKPFDMAEGCPPVDVDTTFPDFNACETADPGRLKSPSRLDLPKAPSFQFFLPTHAPLPFPDLDIDIDDLGCPLDGLDDSSVSIREGSAGSKPKGSLEFDYNSGSCTLYGARLELVLPKATASFAVSANSTGGMSLSFGGVDATFYL